MTKHKSIAQNPSQFFVKPSIEYCNVCGKRANFCIEITYPDPEETKNNIKIDFARQIQGNRQTTNVNNDINDFVNNSFVVSNNLIRICKKCLNHCLKLMYEEERLVMSNIKK